MKRYCVRPSVGLSVPTRATPARFAQAWGNRSILPINRLLHGAQQRRMRRVHAGSATLSAYVVAEHRLVSNKLLKLLLRVWEGCEVRTLTKLPVHVSCGLDSVFTRLTPRIPRSVYRYY